ncbi:MAG: outer membrane protein assembly factor BamD [bacterium]
MFLEFSLLFWASGESKEELFEEGEKLFWSKEYHTAENIFKRIVQQGKDGPLYQKAFLRLAQCYIAMDNYEEAERTLKSLLEKFPESKIAREALFLLGSFQHQLWRMKEAVDVFNEFLKKYPDDDLLPHTLFRLVDCYEHLYDFKSAAETYRLIVSKCSRYHTFTHHPLLRLGHCYLQIGKIKEATEAWKSLLQSFPSHKAIREKVPVLEPLSEKLYGYFGVFLHYHLLGTVSLPHLISLYSEMPEELPPFVANPLSEPALVGPMREATLLSLFGRRSEEKGNLVIVYGTQGDEEDKEAMRKIALERKKWREERMKVSPDVKSDVEVSDEDIRDKHLYLIGNHRCNSVLARIIDDLPIRIEGEAIVVGDRAYEGENIGAIFVVPNPQNSDRYVEVELAVSPKVVFSNITSIPCYNVDYGVFEATLPENILLEEGFFIKPNPRRWRVLGKKGELL